MDDLGPERLSFLGRRLPSWIELRIVVVAPGHSLPYDQAAWRDAIVAVEDGALELECLGGSRQPLVRGDLLWLSGLPLRALHNPGRDPAILTVVSRRAPTAGTDEFRAGRQSQLMTHLRIYWWRILTDEERTT